MNYILYLITRDDGQLYVGITAEWRVAIRMKQHAHDERFLNRKFSYEILETNADRKYIENAETAAVAKYDTFYNGLNRTTGGKAWGHNSAKFTTLGYKYSDVSKLKMSIAAKERAIREGPGTRSAMVKKTYTDNPDLREHLSRIRKGVVQPHMRKLSDDDLSEIIKGYADYNDDRIGTIAANGKPLTKRRLYAKHIADCGKYNVVQNTVYGHLYD